MAKAPAEWGGLEIGTNLLVCVLIAGGAGFGLDMWLGSKPFGLLAGVAVGFAAWLRQVWKMLNPPK
jgi:hypothetical protein